MNEDAFHGCSEHSAYRCVSRARWARAATLTGTRALAGVAPPRAFGFVTGIAAFARRSAPRTSRAPAWIFRAARYSG